MNRIFHQSHAWRAPICFSIEFLLLSSSVILAAVVRFGVTGELSWRLVLPYMPHAVLMALVCQLCMYYAELYDLRTALSNRKLFTRFSQAMLAATMVLVMIFYLSPLLHIGRGVFLLSLVLGFSAVTGWRLIYQHLYTLNHFQVNVLIVGTGEEARKLAIEVINNQPLGYRVKGFIGDHDEVGKDVL